MKSFGLGLFVIGIFLALGLYVQHYNEVPRFREDALKALWQQDVKVLEDSGKLPPGWKNLKTVEIKTTSPTLRAGIDSFTPIFSVTPTGTHVLQIFLDDFEESGRQRVLIQYSLVDLMSMDTVWELGRTLEF